MKKGEEISRRKEKRLNKEQKAEKTR